MSLHCKDLTRYTPGARLSGAQERSFPPSHFPSLEKGTPVARPVRKAKGSLADSPAAEVERSALIRNVSPPFSWSP